MGRWGAEEQGSGGAEEIMTHNPLPITRYPLPIIRHPLLLTCDSCPLTYDYCNPC